ncbi:MAG: helix-turn-helix domain-containing protein [Acidobacteria bacterium]|nr:helix-turn-helix domain-containing protein [Acidobacteriota bacterium]
MIEEIGHDLTRREYVPISRAAQLLGVSRKTVYNWIKKGKVEWFRTPGGRIRIFVDSLGRRDPDDEILYR